MEDSSVVILTAIFLIILWRQVYYVSEETFLLRKRFWFSSRFVSFRFLKHGYNFLIPFIDRIAENNAKRVIKHSSTHESETSDEISYVTRDDIWLGIVLKYSTSIEDDILFINSNTRDAESRRRWMESLEMDGIRGYLQSKLINIVAASIKSVGLISKESGSTFKHTTVSESLKSKFTKLIENNRDIAELKRKEGIKISKIEISKFIVKLDLDADHETMEKIWFIFTESFTKAKEAQLKSTVKSVIKAAHESLASINEKENGDSPLVMHLAVNV